MTSAPLKTTTVLSILKRQAVTHLVGLPDNSSAPLFHAADRDSKLTLITVSREGEAFSLASGLWVGGAKPVVLIQNTGLLESGDALRGTAARMGAPIVTFVTYRGYARMAGHTVPPMASWSRTMLTRPDVDSVALLTEPTLNAWGIRYQHIGSESDAGRLDEVFHSAEAESFPAVALITGGVQ